MLDQTGQTDSPARISRCDPVAFRNVSLKIGDKLAIDNISCTLETIGKTVILGPNGAGKSLFLRLVAGLIRPTSGTISGGMDHGRGQPAPCHSIVFQSPVLLRRTTYQNLAFVLQRQGLGAKEIRTRADKALKRAGLEAQAKTPARRLSGGEQQRLALARALVVNPGALLLDEPTASLDPASTFMVEEMVNDADLDGTKIIFVTHDIRQAKRLADDILFINDGKVLAHKPARAFFRDPGSEQAQAYLDGRVPLA